MMKTALRLRTLSLLACVLVGAKLFGATPPATAPTATEAESTFLNHLMMAIQNGDYTTFVAEGDTNFRHLDKARFHTVSGELAPKLRNGYTLSLISAANEDDAHVTKWTVAFKEGGVSDVATLAVKGGQVVGFLINPAKGHANP